MSYHLFCGVNDHEVYTNGVEGYVGIFETPEAAYKALGYVDDKWAQLVRIHHSGEKAGQLYEYAVLERRDVLPDQERRITSIGWAISYGGGTFIEMERRYQTYRKIDWEARFQQMPKGVTGNFPSGEWIESDPF